jgi:8-oxo-dGTP pyrophosphatase MutT (NUDIX family)
MTITYIGAGIILTRINNNDSEMQYLLLKGRETGVWSFSKGHPEFCDREAPLRTAVRETWEETGLVAGQDYNIMGDSIRFGKRPYWVGMLTLNAADVAVCRAEHSEARWFTWEEICDLNANTDVRAWIKKSRGPNGKFMHLTSQPLPPTSHTRLSA